MEHNDKLYSIMTGADGAPVVQINRVALAAAYNAAEQGRESNKAATAGIMNAAFAVLLCGAVAGAVKLVGDSLSGVSAVLAPLGFARGTIQNAVLNGVIKAILTLDDPAVVIRALLAADDPWGEAKPFRPAKPDPILAAITLIVTHVYGAEALAEITDVEATLRAMAAAAAPVNEAQRWGAEAAAARKADALKASFTGGAVKVRKSNNGARKAPVVEAAA